MAAEIPRSHSSFGLSALRYAAIYVRAGPRRADVKRQKRKKSNSRYSRSHKLCQPGHRCSTGSTAGQCSGHDMSNSVLTFVIVGHDDHPIFESDLAPKPDGREVSCTSTAGSRLHPCSFPRTLFGCACRHKESTCTNLCCTPPWTPLMSSYGPLQVCT